MVAFEKNESGSEAVLAWAGGARADFGLGREREKSGVFNSVPVRFASNKPRHRNPFGLVAVTMTRDVPTLI